MGVLPTQDHEPCRILYVLLWHLCTLCKILVQVLSDKQQVAFFLKSLEMAIHKNSPLTVAVAMT